MKEKTMAEVMARKAEMEGEARMTDHDDDRPRKDSSYLAGYYRGYLNALRWVLDEEDLVGLDGLSGCEHLTKEQAEKLATGMPVKDEKARTYRISAELARVLWNFEEGNPLDMMLFDFNSWSEDRLSDKIFLSRMKVYVETLEKFRKSVLSEALARAIYDGKGGDIEWIEPTKEGGALDQKSADIQTDMKKTLEQTKRMFEGKQ